MYKMQNLCIKIVSRIDDNNKPTVVQVSKWIKSTLLTPYFVLDRLSTSKSKEQAMIKSQKKIISKFHILWMASLACYYSLLCLQVSFFLHITSIDNQTPH